MVSYNVSSKILPTITTTWGAAWQLKIQEVADLKLAEVCLFLTGVRAKERPKLYELLEKTSVQSIPFIHLGSDVTPEEIGYFIKNYKTELFNIHSQKEFPLKYDLSKYKKIIYIENTTLALTLKEIKEFAGICLDFSHIENNRLKRDGLYEHTLSLLDQCQIGCGHISAIKSQANIKGEYCEHVYCDLSDFDYLVKYKKYLPPIMALELINNISQQLAAKKYIEKILEIDV